MIKFIRTNQNTWDSVDKTSYSDSIVFIEDTQQVCANNVNYFGKKLVGVEKVEFSTSPISIEPNKFYFCNEILNELDITLLSERISNYFVEFICDNTCIILPSNIKWENGIVPDFTKTAIMTIKIQDDTAYLIDCIPPYSIQYVGTKKVQPNRIDAFGSEIIKVTESEFLLSESATEIKENAFEGNQDLTSITIPNTVKCIGSNAFSGCSNLQNIEYEGSLKDWNKIEFGEGWKENTSLMYINCKDGIYYIGSYVTFKAQQDNSTIGLAQLSTNQTLEYSTNTTTWSNMDTSTTITLPNAGDEVYIRGMLSDNNSDSNYTQFNMSGKIAASGNCNAIWNYEDLNAPLKERCGYRMFYGCTSLTSTPKLPATTLANYCYYQMFSGCTSFTTAPELPATTLAPYCYGSMFSRCTSLTTAPELPATILAERCYYAMFNGCTNLNYIKCLATDITATNCTTNWVNNVLSTGTFVKHPNMTSWITGVDGIPSGWVIEDADLPYVTFTAQQNNSTIGLTKLSTNQTLEYSMDTITWNTFDTTTNISINNGDNVYVRGVLTADNTTSNYTQFKMRGKIAASGNSNAIWNYQDLSAPLKEYCGFRMFYSCTSLTTSPELPATTLAFGCYREMFRGCTSLTAAPELPATELAKECYCDMFNGCTSLTAAPDLLATKLVNSCYYYMFYNCTKLNYIKCLATDISAISCTLNWVDKVSSTGTFVKHPDATSWTTGNSGIPSEWTVEDDSLSSEL